MSIRSNPWWSLLQLLQGHKPIFLGTLLLGFGNLAGGIATAGVGAWIVGQAAVGSFDKVFGGLWWLAGLVILTALFIWLESWLAHDLAYRVLAELRGKVYSALARLSPAGLIDRRSGDLVSTAMADVEQLEWFYAHSVGAVVTCTLTPLAVLVVLGFIHPLLPLVLLPLIVLAGLLPALMRRRAQRQGKAMRAKLGETNAEVVDAVQGLQELTVFGAEERMAQQLDHHGKLLIGLQIRYGLRAGLESAVSRGVTGLGMLLVLALAANLTTSGQMDAGLYPVTVILSGAVFGPVVGLGSIYGQFGTIRAAAERVFDLVHREPAIQDPVHPITPPTGPVTVRFHQVGFTYEGTETPALKDVSFQIAPGETVALAGASGAGKSSCARLLMRFYDPQQGSVSIEGVNLRSFKLHDLRTLIAPVPQEIDLFDMSLADNIRLGRPDATDSEVEEAARPALAHDFITALPDGYATSPGERGLQLSGGQRQRLAIARAFLSQAPILIMDEAVSNLDGENERNLQRAMERLRQDRTTLVIAHRLSTIQAADRVVVLDQGRVVEQGPPAALLTAGKRLATLMQEQNQSKEVS